MLASLSHSFNPSSISPKHEHPPVGVEGRTAEPSAFFGLLARLSAAAAISSGTLFLTFLFGSVIQHLSNSVDEGGGYARRKPRPISAREVAERVAGVWVCFFAAMELGGVRAAALALVYMASGLESMGVKYVTKRKTVMGAVGVAAAWDLWREVECGERVFGILVAYITLFAATVWMHSPWTPEKPSAHVNRVALVAACVPGAVALLAWRFEVEATAYPGLTNGLPGLGLLACVVGAAAVVFGEEVKENAVYGAGIFAAIAGGWVFGLVTGSDIWSEAGLGGLALAGMTSPCANSRVIAHNIAQRSRSTAGPLQADMIMIMATITRMVIPADTPTSTAMVMATTTTTTTTTTTAPHLLPP